MPAEADRRTSVGLANVRSDPETWKVLKKQVHATNVGFQLQFTFRRSSAHPSPKPDTGVKWLCFRRPLGAICCGCVNNLLRRTLSPRPNFLHISQLSHHLELHVYCQSHHLLFLLHLLAAFSPVFVPWVNRATDEFNKFPLKSVANTHPFSLKAHLT